MTVGVPEIGVYAAFGSKPTDANYDFSTDITDFVRSMSYSRGRQMQLNEIETGRGALQINDSDRRFDPSNTASPYYPNVEPLKPVQARAALAIPVDGLLTMSGNEITDLIRVANVQGDGQLPPAGVGIWEATTNLVVNGGAESNVTGWTSSAGGSIARDTSQFKFGAASGKWLRSATGEVRLLQSAPISGATAGRVYTFSIWVKADASSDTNTCRLRITEAGGASGAAQIVESAPVAITASGWLRLTATATVVQNDRTSIEARLVWDNGTSTAFVFVDGWQVEQKPCATPYVETNGSTATRGNGRVQAPSSLLNASQGWIVARIRYGFSQAAEAKGGSGFDHVFGYKDVANLAGIEVFYREASNEWRARAYSGGVSVGDAQVAVGAFSVGDFATVVGRWDIVGGFIRVAISVNGSAFATTISTLAAFTPTSLFDIGNVLNSNWLDSDVLWFACGKGTLTNADVAAFASFTASTVPDASALFWPPLARTTMVWKAATSACRVATDANLFTHLVSRWPRKRIGRNYAERNITTADGFDLLSLAGLGGKSYGSQLSGALIAAVLNDANWSAVKRSLAAGASPIAAQSFTVSDSQKALPFIQQIVGPGGENALFFINGRGYAVFLDRHSQFGPPYNTSQATFTDIVTMPGELPVTNIVPSSDKDLIFDDWASTRPGAGTQQAIDSTSILKYGRRSQQIESLLTTDGETLSSMQYSLSIYKNPLQRIETMEIKPGNYAELWLQCLSREIGDRITVKEHPPGGGQADIKDYIIQSIDAKFTIGPVGGAVYTWGLFPANASAFILNDLVNGVLNQSAVGY